MKVKHNKKRNTAFLYEVLVRELTKSVVEKDTARTKKIKSILKEHFRSGKVLFGELGCFKALSDQDSFDRYTAEKMIFRAKKEYESFDQQDIFNEQSAVIKKINSGLGKEVFNNFVPDYKSYATLAQIFGNKLAVKSRVIMEQQIIDTLTSEPTAPEPLQPVDNLVVKSFTDRFNDTYVDLLPEQKDLLTRFITSFNENEADFKLFVGEELKRIYNSVENSLTLSEVKEDEQMINGTKKVLDQISEFKVHNITEKHILKILKLQELVREYNNDADND
jgi:flagellin-specific chaperone FliS